MPLMLLGSGGGGGRGGGLQCPYCLPPWYLPPWLLYRYPSQSQPPLLCLLLPLWDLQMAATWWTTRVAVAVSCDERANDRNFENLKSCCDTSLMEIWVAILLLMHHCCAGVFAIILMVSLPLLHWHLCRPCASVFALVALLSLSLLCLLTSLPLLHWHLH